MSFEFFCPTCVSGSLQSRVTIRSFQRRELISGAFFNMSGILIPPTFRNTITTFCSNGHTVVNVVPKIPKALQDKLGFFVENP